MVKMGHAFTWNRRILSLQLHTISLRVQMETIRILATLKLMQVQAFCLSQFSQKASERWSLETDRPLYSTTMMILSTISHMEQWGTKSQGKLNSKTNRTTLKHSSSLDIQVGRSRTTLPVRSCKAQKRFAR